MSGPSSGVAVARSPAPPELPAAVVTSSTNAPFSTPKSGGGLVMSTFSEHGPQSVGPIGHAHPMHNGMAAAAAHGMYPLLYNAHSPAYALYGGDPRTMSMFPQSHGGNVLNMNAAPMYQMLRSPFSVDPSGQHSGTSAGMHAPFPGSMQGWPSVPTMVLSQPAQSIAIAPSIATAVRGWRFACLLYTSPSPRD